MARFEILEVRTVILQEFLIRFSLRVYTWEIYALKILKVQLLTVG